MKKKALGLFETPLLAVGMFFLINPTMSLFDLLPDFIGYLLMYAGVFSLSALDDRMTLASKKLLYLALLSAVKLLAAVATLGYDSSTIMMLCFVFSICEAILISTFLNDWFDGFDYLMQRFGAFSALKYQADTRFITGVFFFTRIALGMLPEFAAIFELRAYFDIDSAPIWSALSSYKPYAMLLFMLIVMIMGVYWYTKSLRYIRAIQSDENFVKNAAERHAAVWDDGKKTDEIIFKAADICVALGFVFICDITLNMVPILATFISSIMFFMACLLLKRFSSPKNLLPWLACACAGQLAFEIFAALKVDPNAVAMSAIPTSTTVVLCLISAIYAAVSIIFILKAEEKLCECRLADTGLSPEKGWKRLNIAYYIFIAARVAGYIFPPIGGVTLWIRLASELTFIIGGIVCWNKAIRVEN